MGFDDEVNESLNYDLDKVNKFIPLGVVMSRTVGKIDPEGKMKAVGPGIDAVQRAWINVAGNQVNEMTSRIFLKGNELIIVMVSPVWAQELNFLAGEYRARINKELKVECVDKITFRSG